MTHRPGWQQTLNDCLALLSYVDKHPGQRQTYQSLSRATGVSMTTLQRLVQDARDDRYGSVLVRAACKYRYDFEVHKTPGKIIDAIYRGYGNNE